MTKSKGTAQMLTRVLAVTVVASPAFVAEIGAAAATIDYSKIAPPDVVANTPKGKLVNPYKDTQATIVAEGNKLFQSYSCSGCHGGGGGGGGGICPPLTRCSRFWHGKARDGLLPLELRMRRVSALDRCISTFRTSRPSSSVSKQMNGSKQVIYCSGFLVIRVVNPSNDCAQQFKLSSALNVTRRNCASHLGMPRRFTGTHQRRTSKERKASAATRTLAAEVVMTTMSTGGKTISERARSRAEVDAFVEAIGDMFCAYLETLSG